MSELDDRKLALAALSRVLDKSRHLEDALAEGGEGLKIDARDRAYAHNLVATTLRRLGQIDALIDGFLDKPLPAKALAAHHILRLGLAQLLFLDTPAHAAVDSSVNLAEASKQGAYKKLINAILRRGAREGRALIETQDAAELNTPGWLWKAWVETYGLATARNIAEAHFAIPPLDITVKSDAEGWAERLGGQLLPSGSVRLTGSARPAELPGFDDGAWWVQDAAAALPARLLGDVKGQTIADLCAAPGGKTAQLVTAGAHVIAVDRSKKRLHLLAQNLDRLALSAELIAADAASWMPDRPVDAVLIDAPCTATGTIRRHPDLQRTKEPGDVEHAVGIQSRLLAHAADIIRPGGIIVFATCSLQHQEGPDLVENLLQSEIRLARMPITAEEIGGADGDLMDAITAAGDLRTLPCHWAIRGGMDGFFAARLRRTD
ncbi:MAG: methyltransferase domain-containing protein [Rhodospirillales bacterium]|nr:methyltransferase domain-containing protein [Rhodospirillales bacterium]